MGQLRMIFDAAKYPVPDYAVPGYRITRHGSEARETYLELRRGTGWNDLPNPEFLHKKVLSEGLIFGEDSATGKPVASATAEWTDFAEYPQLAALGQVMCLEAYRGKKLGLAVSLEAMRVAVERGYRYMSLLTDDYRIPALKIYLGTGWRPWLWDVDMPERWRKICVALNYDYDQLAKYDAPPAASAIPSKS